MTLRRSDVVDGVVAGLLTVFAIIASWFLSRTTGPERPLDAFGVVLALTATVSVAVRRRWPVRVYVVCAAATSTYLIVGYPYGPVLFAYFLATYTLARQVPARRSLPIAGVGLVVLLVHVLTNDAALSGYLGLIPGSTWGVVPYALGTTVRQLRQAAERERAELVREHVHEERLRVAQEVHDVVGHGLAAIKMQADVAMHVLDKRPEQAGTALAAISRTSKEALDELRSTLAVVRHTDERTPAPGLDRLDELRRRMTDAGVDVVIEVEGPPRRLPPAADLAAYRVVQEALTNVLRHSPSKAANVRVGWHDRAVDLVIESTGTGSPDEGAGSGIPGMRDRVESLGGTFEAGPLPDGSFAVRASIPAGDPT